MRTSLPLPSLKELRHAFAYDPDTGVLTRLIKSNSRGRLGSCGYRTGGGYLQVGIGGEYFYVARIAWKLQTGDDPGDYDIDHVNRIPDDNRWINLRLATRSQNCKNSLGKHKRKLKSKGVNLLDRRYKAQIQHGRKKFHIGCFVSEAEG
jgi:hypothetical protein